MTKWSVFFKFITAVVFGLITSWANNILCYLYYFEYF